MGKKKQLKITSKARAVFLKDGDTSYTISLDGLDMALLPMDKLLDKYSGNQQAAIWSLDSSSKEVEYLDQWDNEFCEFEVEAMKSPAFSDPTKNSIICHICQIKVPNTHINEHNDSEGHRVRLKMASKAADRMNKHMIQEKLCDSFIKVQNEKKSLYYCATCNIFVDLLNTNHHNDVEHLITLKREKLYIKFYEKYERLGRIEPNTFDTTDEYKVQDKTEKTELKETQQSRAQNIKPTNIEQSKPNEESNSFDIIDEYKVQDNKEKTELKVTQESHGQNIKPTNIEKREPNEQRNIKCDKKSKSRKVADRYCSVCDIYVANTKNNVKGHYNGKTHKSNIVRNEKHKIETASETSIADVVITKSHVAITASDTRNDTTARSIHTTDDEEAVVKAIHIFNDFVNSRIKITDKIGRSMGVVWGTWHGLDFASDFQDSGNMTCGLCKVNFPFENIYDHVKNPNHTYQASLSIDDGIRALSSKSRDFCLVCQTFVKTFANSGEDHKLSSFHARNLKSAKNYLEEFSALTNDHKERQILSCNSLRFIKPYLQRCHISLTVTDKIEAFYAEFGNYETINLFQQPGDMIQLLRQYYHSLDLLEMQNVIDCLLCKEVLLPEQVISHVSSKRHLDRVGIPFTDVENCIRCFEYSKNKFEYHCAHCNDVISKNEGELSLHLNSTGHQNQLKSSLFQHYGGEWRLKIDVRRMTQLSEERRKGGNKGKWLCLLVVGAVLAYRYMKVRQVPTPTRAAAQMSFGDHFLNANGLSFLNSHSPFFDGQ